MLNVKSGLRCWIVSTVVVLLSLTIISPNPLLSEDRISEDGSLSQDQNKSENTTEDKKNEASSKQNVIKPVKLVVQEPLPFKGAWYENLEEATREAKKQNLPLLMHFHAHWCPPCLKMEANVLNTKEVEQVLGSSVVGVKIDHDKRRGLAEDFKIGSLPCDIVVTPDGQLLLHREKPHSKAEYLAFLAMVSDTFKKQHAAKITPKALPKDPLDKTFVGLGGYCPVTLGTKREWKKGAETFQVAFQEIIYHCETREAQQEFESNPKRYAPQLLGCDPVIFMKEDKAIVGLVQYGAFYDGSLYLFLTDENRKTFKAHPEQFAKTRHVIRDDLVGGTKISKKETETSQN